METSVPPQKGPQQATAASLRTPYGIGDLPTEVLLNIFQFFNVNQLQSTISPVCRLWHDLSQRPFLRLQLKLEMEYRRLDTSGVGDLLRSCPNLKDLSIAKCSDMYQLLRYVALYNHELPRLAVNDYNDWPVSEILSEQVLNEILLCCPNIVDLTIMNYVRDCSKFFRDLGVRLPELRRINFYHSSFFGPEELKMVVTHCGKLEEIHALNWYRELCDEDIFFVAERLRGTLKVLEINGKQLTDEGFAALGQCCQLRELHVLNAFEITDEGVFHLLRLHKLDDLLLRGLKTVSPDGWVQLFSKSSWRQMKKLFLPWCDKVNDDTLRQVTSSCPNLVELSLTWCKQFTDEGLSIVLQKYTDLEYLDIWGTKGYGFNSLSYIPLHTPKLKCLMYDGFSEEEEDSVLMHLMDTMPELKIHSDPDACV